MGVRNQKVKKMPNRLIRVLIVEDHEVVRIGLRTILSQSSRLESVGEVGTCKEAQVEATRLQPQVILMDMRLPDGTGAETCRDILNEHPEMKILFLSSYSEEESMFNAVLAGACGYLLKEMAPELLTRAIEMVVEGHSILNSSAIERVLAWARGQEVRPPLGMDCELTAQQHRVLALVAKGQTNKEIASALSLSDKTVRNYLAVVFEKFQISRRSQAAAIYMKHQNETSNSIAYLADPWVKVKLSP